MLAGNRQDGSNDSISKIKGASIILIINAPLPFFEISHHKNRPGEAIYTLRVTFYIFLDSYSPTIPSLSLSRI